MLQRTDYIVNSTDRQGRCGRTKGTRVLGKHSVMERVRNLFNGMNLGFMEYLGY